MARIETFDTSVKLVERRESDGLWVVRWDFRPKYDDNGNESGIYWYEEEAYNWIPSIEDIQRTIVDWFNKQTDITIKKGFEWKGINVLLSDENKFNFSLFAIEAERREKEIAEWDKNNPDLKGVNFIVEEYTNVHGEVFKSEKPTGRKPSRLPITFKLGEGNDLSSFYTFTTIEELFEFTSASTDHLNNAYASGWTKIATFDWSPYIRALEDL